jgi:hypothetical protein
MTALQRPARRCNARPLPLTLIGPDSAVDWHGCVAWLRAMTVLGEPPHRPAQQLDGVSDRVRLARSDADRVFGTGAGCRHAGD